MQQIPSPHPDAIEMSEALAPHRIERLSPQLRRAARFVVDNPGEVATRSLRHVAQEAELPAPTFSRLARAIGYDNYDALKDRCREDLLERHGDFPDAALALKGHEVETFTLPKHVRASVKGIETLLRDIDPVELAEIATRLANARRVVLIGEMRARAFVDYATYLSDMSIDGWAVIGRGTVSLAAETRDLGPDDAAIIVTMKPYSRRSVETARFVADMGTPVIALTDSQVSPVAGIAKHVLVASANSPQFFPSYVVTTLLIETLVGMVVAEKGDDAQRRIAETARRSRDLNEYWRD
ncbi:MAG: MurR/RpiR family transcriptional regulator [Roseovarius sp.]